MSNELAVSVKNLSKMYLLYRKPQDRLKQSLFHRFGKDYARTFWALQDVSFELERGKALGIIGRNGSGKSTLLQIVCGTLQATAGAVSLNGRITALLELGAGFNPEFTGRENIYLNGATLGIPTKEMKQRLDQIINFAQIGDFIDQPVKLYSSGMYVRLAFAISTSVDPDVLIIDEALAVGDAGFVIKCMNRMRQLQANGTTILLVTHDVQTVRSFCNSAIWLKDGRLQANGSPLDVTSQYIQYLFEGQSKTSDLSEQYLSKSSSNLASFSNSEHLILLSNIAGLVRWGNGKIQIESFSINDRNPSGGNVFEYGELFQITIVAIASDNLMTSDIGVGMAMRNNKGLDIITSTTYDQGLKIPPLIIGQRLIITFEFENILSPGDYALVLNVEDRCNAIPQYYDFVENAIIIKTVSRFPIFSQVLPHVIQKITILNENGEIDV
jgi:lipopolysaccharide transport system ATP-binding protein